MKNSSQTYFLYCGKWYTLPSDLSIKDSVRMIYESINSSKTSVIFSEKEPEIWKKVVLNPYVAAEGALC